MVCVPTEKNPVFFDFDFKFTKEKFLELLIKIQKCGFLRIGVVCGFGSDNRKLLKDLGISYLNPALEHKHLENPLFFFADIPHMFKLLRNHLLDNGFFVNNSYNVTKDILNSILQLDKDQLKLCHKLSNAHVTVSNFKRQNVRMAIQVFSETTAKFIQNFIPNSSLIAIFLWRLIGYLMYLIHIVLQI